MISAVYDRRSIRKFLDKPIAGEDLTEILESGIKAPSSKNRQPWKFVVVQGTEKEEMLKAFRRGISREEKESALLPGSRRHIPAAKYTVDIMEEAPVIVFVLNTLGNNIFSEMTPEEHIYEICNIQSISAAVQNMLLAATDKGIGSLWICDIFFAYAELCKWLNTGDQLMAAVAFGYPNESPKERPRKKWEDVVVFRG